MMISAVRRRRLLDSASSVAVRTMSLLVLAAVAGMLIQLVLTALPLTESPRVVQHESQSLAVSISLERDVITPPWVPEDIPRANWQLLNERGLWYSITSSGELIGQILRFEAAAGKLQYQDLPASPVAAGTLLTLVNAPRDSVLIIEPSGVYRFLSHHGKVKYQGKTDAFDTVHVLPGDAGFLGVNGTSVDHWHWVRDGDTATFLRRQTIQLPAAVQSMHVDPSGERVLLLLENQRLELRSILSGELLVDTKLSTPIAEVFWVDKRIFGLNYLNGETVLWRLAGDIDGVDVSRLFMPITYPGYSTPRAVWQPLASTQGHSVKLNVLPLLVGTFKTAMLAMLFAVPVAIGAATFVGYFMIPSHRNRVKPLVEMIAAFPTVVIGAIFAIAVTPVFFSLSAQWLGALLITPLAIAVLAVSWRSTGPVLAGNTWLSVLPLLLIPLGVVLIAMGIGLGSYVEQRFFGGDLMAALSGSWGLDYQSHNSLLVAFAMGFAIIPSIFTVAEDAINGVPRSLGSGSLALGASQWQSFSSVVLPVALPGISAAVLLGFGRAIGETMILLMLSGNAPDTGLNPFSAVRSIAATLAIELPDAAVDSAHFRVLVLAALMLFAVSFLFNTAAQLLKRRLLRKIGQIN